MLNFTIRRLASAMPSSATKFAVNRNFTTNTITSTRLSHNFSSTSGTLFRSSPPRHGLVKDVVAVSVYFGGQGLKGIGYVMWFCGMFLCSGIWLNKHSQYRDDFRINKGTGELAVEYNPYQPFEVIRKTVGVDIREPYKEDSCNFSH